MADEFYLLASRALVKRVLTGDLTPESDLATFSEDTLFHALLTLQADDPDWLQSNLDDPSHPAECRALLQRILPRLM